jgi:hypothetical protein
MNASTVPGGTVLLSTTDRWPDAGGSTTGSTRAIASTVRSTCERSVLPFGDDGVPTQISTTSALLIASEISVVACNRSESTARCTRSSRPGSATGETPRDTAATFSRSTSTAQTS